MSQREATQGTYQRVGGWTMMQWPPFDIEKVTYFNYVLDADMSALRKLCDAFFNTPSEGAVRYEPLIPQVVFSYAQIEKATSSDPAAGSTPENDILLWTPIARLTPDGARVLAVPVFSPYVFVDNATAVQLGREMFGFPKNWCEIVSAPEGPESARDIIVKAYAKPADEPVLRPREIFRLANLGQVREPVWMHDSVEILRELARVLASFVVDADGLGAVRNAEALALAASSLLARKQTFAFLKQFPAMSAPGRCCYQAIGEMDTTLGAIERFGILPFDYELSFVDDVFHDFAGSFGWCSGPLKVRAAFYMDFSFTLDGGRVVWQAPTLP
ncbi:MAG: hypothetical protein OHK0013_42620 [Sandaracinaceae bacterium]